MWVHDDTQISQSHFQFQFQFQLLSILRDTYLLSFCWFYVILFRQLSLTDSKMSRKLSFGWGLPFFVLNDGFFPVISMLTSIQMWIVFWQSMSALRRWGIVLFLFFIFHICNNIYFFFSDVPRTSTMNSTIATIVPKANTPQQKRNVKWIVYTSIGSLVRACIRRTFRIYVLIC